MSLPSLPAPASVFLLRDPFMVRAFEQPEVCAAFSAALVTVMPGLGVIGRTAAGVRLFKLVSQGKFTSGEAAEAWWTVKLLALALHEAAHVTGVYLFQRVGETQVQDVILPGPSG